MKKNIYAMTCAVMLTMSASAAEKPGIWDGIKEAAKGIVWMVRVEVCKIDMALFSKAGLNMFYLNYKCEHTDHRFTDPKETK